MPATRRQTQRCPSGQFALSYDVRAHNPAGTCAVCGKHVRATKSGSPWAHNRAVPKPKRQETPTFRPAPFGHLTDKTIINVEVDVYGRYVDLTAKSGETFRVTTSQSSAHNETWNTVKLQKKDKR